MIEDVKTFMELYREAMLRDHGPLMLVSAWFHPTLYSMNPNLPPSPPFASGSNPVPLMKLARSAIEATRNFDKSLATLAHSLGKKYEIGGPPCPLCGDAFCPGSPPIPMRPVYGTPFLLALMQGKV